MTQIASVSTRLPEKELRTFLQTKSTPATPAGENYAVSENNVQEDGMLARLANRGRRIASKSPAPRSEPDTEEKKTSSALPRARQASLSPIPATQRAYSSPRSQSAQAMGETPGFGDNDPRRHTVGTRAT